jgi:ABC-2 type transport system permease protein
MPTAVLSSPRAFGPVNWLGLWTLYLKEVRRFLKVSTQTLLSPVVTTLLYMAVFSLALGGALRSIGGVPFIAFLAPGLVMMAMVQNAFANTSSSLVIAKIQGNIVDFLMPPLTPGELALGLVAGGVTRGLLVGLVTALAMLPFAPFGLHDPFFIVFHAVAACVMLSLLGVVGGIWSEKFDHIASVTNFIITPLAFLSGAFYSVQQLPGIWYTIAHLDPFFYMIDGFRYGFIGHADGSLTAGIVVLTAVNVGLWALAVRLFALGYKLKA